MTVEKDEALQDDVSPALLNALEAGVNAIDTARAYGASERIVGRTLKEWNGPRPLLFTKVQPLDYAGWFHPRALNDCFTPQNIRESVEQSLRTLDVDILDFIQLHQWQALWEKEPTWLETLNELRDEGKVRAVGVSALDHEHDAALPLLKQGVIDGIQVIFNCFESRPLRAFLPFAGETGTGVIARGVLDHGGLSESMTVERMRKHGQLKKAPPEKYAARRAALAEALGDSSESLSCRAIRFALTPNTVSTLTLPLHRDAYLADALAAVEAGPLEAEQFEAVCRDHTWPRNFFLFDPSVG